jgi:hypothetical protein
MGANTCTVFQCLTVLMDLTGLAFYLTYKQEPVGEQLSRSAPLVEVSLEE